MAHGQGSRPGTRGPGAHSYTGAAVQPWRVGLVIAIWKKLKGKGPKREMRGTQADDGRDLSERCKGNPLAQ